MGRFYRLKHMFSIGFHTMAFPTFLFYSRSLKTGWRRWSRRWWNNVFRFGGWRILRRWQAETRKDRFSDKLEDAQRTMDARESGETQMTGHEEAGRTKA